MKKTFQQPDGSFVTIEGTPDEIRQYERILEKEREPKQKQGSLTDVLKGQEAQDALRKLLDELASPPRSDPPAIPFRPAYPPPAPYQPWCIKCGTSPCTCWITYPMWPQWPQIWCKTITVSGDSTLPPSNTYDVLSWNGFDGPGMY